MDLIYDSFKGLNGELIRNIFENSDFIVKFAFVLMSTIPPFFVSFFHQLNLQRIICSFFACNLDVYSLILLNVGEFQHITIVSDFLTLQIVGSWVIVVAFDTNTPRNLHEMNSDFFNIWLAIGKEVVSLFIDGYSVFLHL